MGKINQNIKDYISLLEEKGIEVKFCDNFKPLPQSGQVCKLVAGTGVQDYLFARQENSQAPLPLLKNNGFFTRSVRERAKQKVHSQVGELYGSKQVRDVFNYNNFETISYQITEKPVYEKFLVSSLEQMQPAIVYFDVTPRFDIPTAGDPDIYNGNFEHAAVITGFYYQDDKLRLIAAQWGDFHDISFDKLFESASQLNAIKQAEHYEKYYPVPGYFDKKMWVEKEQMEHMFDFACDYENSLKRIFYSFLIKVWPKANERTSQPPLDETGSLLNNLTVIKGDTKKIMLDEFEDYKIVLENAEMDFEEAAVSNTI